MQFERGGSGVSRRKRTTFELPSAQYSFWLQRKRENTDANFFADGRFFFADGNSDGDFLANGNFLFGGIFLADNADAGSFDNEDGFDFTNASATLVRWCASARCRCTSFDD